MPELPDVEVLRRYVDSTSLHRAVEDVFLRRRLVERTSPQTIRDRLRGSELMETTRHGKHLFIRSSEGGSLRLHFGMTGTLHAFSRGEQPDHTELRLDLDDGSHLAYVSLRKLGAISWEDDVEDFVEDHGLGPDPLTQTGGGDVLAERMRSRKGSVKGTLMDQGVMAGLGNVYVDEILFQAGIHPRSDAAALNEDEARHLQETIWHVIGEAIDHGADPTRMPHDWLLAHREAAVPCPLCAGRIERDRVTGRSTYYCGGHQQFIA